MPVHWLGLIRALSIFTAIGKAILLLCNISKQLAFETPPKVSTYDSFRFPALFISALPTTIPVTSDLEMPL